MVDTRQNDQRPDSGRPREGGIAWGEKCIDFYIPHGWDYKSPYLGFKVVEFWKESTTSP
ncbi:hypothetical protein FACS189485_04100 [Spirochaetia bacterium]|nr:hypothetical protein FACS189485_04100 [Spirochaetia bacterium]